MVTSHGEAGKAFGVRERLSAARPTWHSAWVLVTLPAVLLALGAEPVAVRLSYDAPAGCPSQDAFYDAVRARTDRVRLAVGDESHLDVSVRVTGGDRGFRGEVRESVNQGESSVRSVDGGTCKEVVEALSLTVALSIDPDAHAPSAPAVSLPQKQPVPCLPCAAQPRTAVAPGAAPVQLDVGLGVLGTVVDTAGFSVGGALSARLLRARSASASTSSAVQVSLLFASTGVLSAPSDHRTRFGALALDACPWRHHSGAFEFAPCALAALGFLELSGRGLAEPETVDRAWWSAGLDLQLSWLLGGGYVFEGALGATVPLVKHRYFTNAPDHVVTETPALSPLARIGLGYRF